MLVNMVMNMVATATKFKWTNGMLDDLLSSLLQFKSNIDRSIVTCILMLIKSNSTKP